jgi:hypothetical protein
MDPRNSRGFDREMWKRQEWVRQSEEKDRGGQDPGARQSESQCRLGIVVVGGETGSS